MTAENRAVPSFLCITLTAVALACGSADKAPTTVATVGAAGATLSVGSSALTIPANALSAPTQITLREAEPQHAGRVRRVEIEPRGLALGTPGLLATQVDDTNAHVKMHGDDDGLLDVEVEDRNHGSYKTDVTQLGAVEVELEHGAACAAACASGQECDDGVCKAHVEDAGAATCSSICPSGEECDDGTCKLHGETSGSGVTGACSPSCATGLECDNGVCKPHHA